MSRSAYYDRMRQLALEKRAAYGVATAKFGLREVREIYKRECIAIDLRPLSSRIRAVYMCDDDDPSVLVNKLLPTEPRLFSMVHELKHHFVDRETMAGGALRCGNYNANQMIEIGAEVFAAEFIYPESEFIELADVLQLGQGTCSPEQVVELKRACPAKVSYAFLRKRLERFGFASKDCYKGVQFRKLEEEMYPPAYKQGLFRQELARKLVSAG